MKAPLDYIMRIRSDDGGIEWNPLVIESFLKEVHTRLGNWQPIETALIDGEYTKTLLLAQGDRVYVGFYNQDLQEWAHDHYHLGIDKVAPTHWMPLPEPPKED